MKRVTAAVIERGGKILIAQRKKGEELQGKWEFPGGKMEPGETPEECLKRELREEFGIEAEIGAFICSSKFQYKNIQAELLAYRVKHISGEFVLNDHDRIEWIKAADLPRYDLSSPDIPVADLLIQLA